jgi:hypothetical protein
MSQDELLFILMQSGVVFVLAYFANLISFGGRFTNALVTAIIAAIAAAALIFVVFGESTLATEDSWRVIAVVAAAVFVADLIANILTFSSRFLNAIVTAAVFAGFLIGANYSVI